MHTTTEYYLYCFVQLRAVVGDAMCRYHTVLVGDSKMMVSHNNYVLIIAILSYTAWE